MFVTGLRHPGLTGLPSPHNSRPPPGEHRPDDAGHLVGQCDRCQTSGFAFEQLLQPVRLAWCLATGIADDAGSTNDQQTADIGVAGLGDAARSVQAQNPRVGFIVTNLARPAERVVAFYNQRGRRSSGSRKARGRHQMDAAVLPDLRRQCRAPSAPCAGLQPRRLHAAAGNAEGSGAVVADQPAREASQDRRQGGEPWRYVTFRMAEVAVPRQMFAEILTLIARPRAPPATA
jgi:hypothetical protein